MRSSNEQQPTNSSLEFHLGTRHHTPRPVWLRRFLLSPTEQIFPAECLRIAGILDLQPARFGFGELMRKKLDKANLGHLEDWRGNNIAFVCPSCGKVVLVSGMMDKKGHACPCGKSKGYMDVQGENASIEYSDPAWSVN